MVEAKDLNERKTGSRPLKGQESGTVRTSETVRRKAQANGQSSRYVTVLETADEQDKPAWFHICSQGLERIDLFPDENAYIAGVNRFAVAFKLFGEDVEVAILVLVSNHFHSLVWGRRPDVVQCAERYKKTISMYYSHRFGTSKVMCRVRLKVEKVDSEEYLKNAIGYILNNPRKHRETHNPFSYPWSSILEYFDEGGKATVLRPVIVDIPSWRRPMALGTNRQIPQSWEIYANGMVTFGSFISPARLESVVKTIGSLSYLVNKADLNANQGEAVRYPDNDREVRGAVARICPILFPDSVASFDESEFDPVRNTGYCLKERRKTVCAVAEDMLGKLNARQIIRLRSELSTRYGFPLKIVDRVLHSGYP